MNIKTKLDIGDSVWFIGESKKACQSVVRGIDIRITEDKPNLIIYLLNNSPNERIFLKLDECHAYKSKRELIASI